MSMLRLRAEWPRRQGEPARRRAAAIALIFALGLGACSTDIERTGDKIPVEFGGLPPGTPERAAVPPAYPAVHDMPPPREGLMLDAYSQKKLEQELSAARDRQEGRDAASRKGLAPVSTGDTGTNRNP
jgi:hypothetical protein